MRKFNSTLNQYTPLKSKTPLKAHKGLNHVSKKQALKNALWNKITEQKCIELHYICQWCGKIGHRNDRNDLLYLDGHHIIKRRYNIHTKENCYIIHRICHNFIEDNNVCVEQFPTKIIYEKGIDKVHTTVL